MSLCRLSGSTRQAIPRRELGSPATELGLHPEDGLGPSASACERTLGDCRQWGPKPRRSLGRDSALQVADKPLWGVEL